MPRITGAFSAYNNCFLLISQELQVLQELLQVLQLSLQVLQLILMLILMLNF